MPLRAGRSLLLVALPLAGLLLAASACTTTVADPAAVETPFAFQVSNPGELEGPVLGRMLQPFVAQPIVVGTADASPADAWIDAFVEAGLTADGTVAGTLIAPAAVPRINDGLGGGMRPMLKEPSPWFFFFPPGGCPMTTTNALEAAIAPISSLLVWDGVTVDANGDPVWDGLVRLGTWTYTIVDGVETSREEAYVPVASRSAWSASSDGPCDVDTGGGGRIRFDVALTIDVGWQVIHVVSIQTHDGLAGSREDFARSLTLEEFAALGPVGEVVPRMSEIPLAPAALGPMFR
jgi:hypothetical protein